VELQLLVMMQDSLLLLLPYHLRWRCFQISTVKKEENLPADSKTSGENEGGDDAEVKDPATLSCVWLLVSQAVMQLAR
jgi:hypothetical protein